MDTNDNGFKLKSNQHIINIVGPVSEFNPETGDEEISFSLEHLFPQDRAIIQQAFMNVDGYNEIFFIEKGKSNSVLHFFIPTQNINEFYNRSLPQFHKTISDAIAGKRIRGGQMKTEYLHLENLPEQIRHRIDATPLQQDIDTAQQNITDNWEKVLEKINDPEVRKRLLLYQMTDSFAANYGWQLSRANIASILQQKPDATFVTSLEMWEKIFMHTVNPGAQRIIITKPASNTNTTLDDLNTAAAKRNFGNYSNAMKASNNSTQTRMGIHLAAKQKGAHNYVDWVVYDVSDTTPMNQENDKWAIEMGLIDNLRAIPNIPLSAKLNDMGKKEEEIRQGGLSDDQLKEFRKKLFKFSKKVVGHIDELQYASDDVAIETMIFEIGKVYAEQANIIKESNKESFAAKLCYIVAATVGTQLSYVQRFIREDKFDKKTVAMSWEAYQEILRCLPSNNKVEETVLTMIEPLNFTQFVDTLKKINTEIMTPKEEQAINELKKTFDKLCR